jgi:exo-1,4-beta-D-glucosaminidase
MTPTASYADYTSLAQLPKVKLNVSANSGQDGKVAETRVTLENPSKNLAFFVRLKIDNGKGGKEILPVVWEDNYISLLPGERREITATYHTSSLGEGTPEVEVSGFNVE